MPIGRSLGWQVNHFINGIAGDFLFIWLYQYALCD
jgi:hypothetical protein